VCTCGQSSITREFANPPLQITGDDTPAIQAVLDADVWRKILLREQNVRPSLAE